MQSLDQTSTIHDSESECHPIVRKNETPAHEHLALDGAFWLETEGAQLSRWFATAPNSSVSLEAGGWIALSGEPWIGFNVACVLHSPGAASLFVRYASSLADQPGTIFVETVTPEIFELAEHVGARHVGETPLMVFDEAAAPLQTDSVVVRHITTSADLTPTVVLIAECFSMNVQACIDLFEPMLEEPNAGIWVAERDRHIVSAVMSLRMGSIVGLHCLATAREYRGQGIGRSLVRQLIARQMANDARRFFLHTTAEGRRFAEGIGCRPAGFPHTFILNGEQSTATAMDAHLESSR